MKKEYSGISFSYPAHEVRKTPSIWTIGRDGQESLKEGVTTVTMNETMNETMKTTVMKERKKKDLAGSNDKIRPIGSYTQLSLRL